MTRSVYSDDDRKREYEDGSGEDPWRSAYSRDYGRIVHSASFRRLQGKTQVFPGHESDFFRSRLTHSLEVAQIAEGIVERLNHVHDFFKQTQNHINPRLVAAASLIHDLGHPPFGHNGERALDRMMLGYGGFEGNAQTLRIVSRLERKVFDKNDNCYGLNLTLRTLAAILKYDEVIPTKRAKGSKVAKGYYESEAALVKKIKNAVTGEADFRPGKFKALECAIMDLADDIAYSTYDLEDCLKAGFLTPAEILASPDSLLSQVAEKVGEELKRPFSRAEVMAVFQDIFEPPPPKRGARATSNRYVEWYQSSQNLANSSRLRTRLSSDLVHEAILAVDVELDEEFPMMSKPRLSDDQQKKVEVLKWYTRLTTIYSSRVKLAEYRGFEVVKSIFVALAHKPNGSLLMPVDVRTRYEAAKDDKPRSMRIVCDFVAGMTDRYALEFYGRLASDNPQSMWKPI
ncbi:dGTPase [Bosea sp. OK403]|uniref:dGTP triphosphohydrolase n=1 Tax=Bosea sp. OK403 TaxID=1855286 RepID=UPI0008ED453A|nr:dNTP triphosphohydrolase [Bosea sp. OK403]SFJ77231.1 dGTPase [Bosea sp. OK403]